MGPVVECSEQAPRRHPGRVARASMLAGDDLAQERSVPLKHARAGAGSGPCDGHDLRARFCLMRSDRARRMPAARARRMRVTRAKAKQARRRLRPGAWSWGKHSRRQRRRRPLVSICGRLVGRWQAAPSNQAASSALRSQLTQVAACSPNQTRLAPSSARDSWGSGQTQPCDLQRAATTLLHLTARFAR
jgi:hypothetical protein